MSQRSLRRDARRRADYFYAFLTALSGSIVCMEDLWFVGLTLLLAVLTWLGIRLCARLLERS